MIDKVPGFGWIKLLILLLSIAHLLWTIAPPFILGDVNDSKGRLIIWQDEFNGDSLNTRNWKHIISGWRGGNKFD